MPRLGLRIRHRRTDAGELRGLAGREGEPYIIALNPGPLTESLTSIAREIGTARVLIPLVRLIGPAGMAPVVDRIARVRGIVDSTNLPAEVRAVVDVADRDADRRWMPVIFFALFGVLCGGALPRLAWSVPVAPVAVALVGTGAACFPHHHSEQRSICRS